MHIATRVFCGIVISVVILRCSEADSTGFGFKSSPGIVRIYPEQHATLVWTFQAPTDTNRTYLGLSYLVMPQRPIYTIDTDGASAWQNNYGQRSHVTVTPSTVEFTLNQVTPFDTTNNFECEISFAIHTYSNITARIFIFGSPTSPVLTPSPEDPVAEDMFNLTCSSNTTSVPSDLAPLLLYTWTRNNQSLEDSRHIKSGKQDNTLTIDPVTREDHEAEYECKVQEDGSKLSNTATRRINVRYGPYNMALTHPGSPQNQITITEHEELNVNCSALCNPPCTYTWSKDDIDLETSNQVLLLADIKRRHHGTYTCEAKNDFGISRVSLKIIVNFMPNVTPKILLNTDIVQGSHVTMVCSVDSRPPPSSIVWLNTTGQISPNFDTEDNNETSKWVTINKADILDSGVFQCTAENVVGVSEARTVTLDVKGPPRFHMAYPRELKDGVRLGVWVNFTVSVIANPLPSLEEWRWSFISTNTMNTSDFLDSVTLVVEGDKATLNITIVTQEHYGNYTLMANNSYGVFPGVTFQLSAEGPPSPPTNVQVVRATAVSIVVEWVPGFDGGPPQTFVVIYKNTRDDRIFTTEEITDTATQLSLKISNGIEPNTTYELRVRASNRVGESHSSFDNVTTPAAAAFQDDLPTIKISDGVAEIEFIITGSLTHIVVENCVQDSSTCLNETIDVADRGRGRRRGAVSDRLQFTEQVLLADPSEDSFVFSFWFYDGDDLVNQKLAHTEKRKPDRNLYIYIGAACAAVVVVVVVITVLILWRKGRLKKSRSMPASQTGRLTEPSNVHVDEDINPYGETPSVLVDGVNGSAVQDDVIAAYSYTPATMIDKPPHEDAQRQDPANGLYSSVGDEPDSRHTVRPESMYPPKTTVTPGTEKDVYAEVDKSNKTKNGNVGLPTRHPVDVYSEVDKRQQPSYSQNNNGQAQGFAVYAEVDKNAKKGLGAVAPRRSAKEAKDPVDVYAVVDKSKKTNNNEPVFTTANRQGQDEVKDVYAEVDKSRNRPSKVTQAHSNAAYSNEEFSDPPPRPARARGDTAMTHSPPTPLVGPDGTVYADLDMVPSRPSDVRPVIRGDGGRTQYSDIDFVATQKHKN